MFHARTPLYITASLAEGNCLGTSVRTRLSRWLHAAWLLAREITATHGRDRTCRKCLSAPDGMPPTEKRHCSQLCSSPYIKLGT